VKISVITVCYNSAATIEDTLQSVARQTHPDVEHIVIDGGSTDGTREIIDRHRHRIAKVVSEPDRGIYDAMNKGIRLASGELVGTLNSDDIYETDQVLARVAEVMTNPALDACYGDLVYVDRATMQRVLRYWKSKPYQSGACLRGWMPAHPTFFLRRALYERYGGYDLHFRLQSDFEMMLRLFEVHRIRTEHIPEVMVRMRMGGVSNSSIRNVVAGNLEAMRACRKHHFAVNPWFMVRKVLSRLPQFTARLFFRPE
jgi:glycosyltransferase involved in cell wall biosynthesis